MGSPAVEPHIEELKSEKLYMRKAAANLLGEIGGRRATESLISALKDVNEEVRQAASHALDKLGWQPSADEVGAHYWIAKKQWQECLKIGLPSAAALITIMKIDRSFRMQRACYVTIEQISGTQLHENDIEGLVEASVSKIKRLYERTRTVTEERQIELGDTWQWEYSDYGEADHVQYTDYETYFVDHEEPEPDIEGIREFAESLPESLRERVRPLCGEAGSLF
jgi:hypothetical protein